MTFLRPLLCAAFVALSSLPAAAEISRDDAVALVQRETGGRVLSVDRSDTGGRAVWRVKVVTPRGDVRVVLVDVASGQTQ